MECDDLERYLEAFLDGRLGRGRGAVLQRHLLTCGTCQARVERLRQFERDMQRRFRALEQVGSVWQGLELVLVVSSRASAAGRLPALPGVPASTPTASGAEPRRVSGRQRKPAPATPAIGRSRVSKLAGVLLIAMAAGALYELAHSYGLPSDDVETAENVYRQFLSGAAQPSIRSDDAEQLRAWLSTELGTGVPAPPLPNGYHLIGADHASLAPGQAGALIYAGGQGKDASPVVLFLRPSPSTTGPTSKFQSSVVANPENDGLNEFAWNADGFHYTLVGRQTSEELKAFIP